MNLRIKIAVKPKEINHSSRLYRIYRSFQSRRCLWIRMLTRRWRITGSRITTTKMPTSTSSTPPLRRLTRLKSITLLCPTTLPTFRFQFLQIYFALLGSQSFLTFSNWFWMVTVASSWRARRVFHRVHTENAREKYRYQEIIVLHWVVACRHRRLLSPQKG